MRSPPSASSLSHCPLGASARVAAVDLVPDDVAYLHALGIFAGQVVTVLRRAAWGGPLHVRTASGGEFAIGRDLAAHIAVEPAAATPPGAE